MNTHNEEEYETVLLEDSEGTEMQFERLAIISYDGAEYAIFLPQMSFGEDELVILRIVRGNDGGVLEYHGIEDFDVLEAVFDLYCTEAEAR